MPKRHVILYVGQWNGREYAFSLDAAHAKSLTESCFAFGDPAVDEYALGNAWAASDDDPGWRIVTRPASLLEVGVSFQHDEEAGPSHVHWQCPYCLKWRSDDWLPDDRLPVLLGCGCQEASRHLLGTRVVNLE